MMVAIAWRTGAILARFSGEHEAGLERETRMPSTVALHAHARFALASPRLKKEKKQRLFCRIEQRKRHLKVRCFKLNRYDSTCQIGRIFVYFPSTFPVVVVAQAPYFKTVDFTDPLISA